jgi:osmotically-inducible protein OsmY
MKTFLSALFVGGLLEYFLDPAGGSKRRGSLMDKVQGMMGQAGTSPQKVATYAGNQVQGKFKRAVGSQHDNDNPDDKTLKDRVQSEVLRDPTFGDAPINFNVENGIVVIHGELPTQADIDRLVSQVKNVRDVKGVENLLHLPGTPAPNKESAIQAS